MATAENSEANVNHQIFQTDDAITIVYSDETDFKSPASDNLENLTPDAVDLNVNENIITSKLSSSLSMNDELNVKVERDDEEFPKSILTSDLVRTYSTKKSVSFEQDETVTKFIEGDEIKDKKNPFRNAKDENLEVYRNGNGIRKIADDFISKEEILRQSKFVPVYIKNPDRVLTYDRTVLEQMSNSPKPKIAKRPVPVPRKAVRKSKEFNRKTNNIKYPDLSDIKVKTGTDLEESLYDPNEVVLNAKKFDSLFKKLKFNSTDNLDEIGDLSVKEEEAKGKEEQSSPKDEEGKSYTNTVNSSEFREYLKKKGLILFPTKPKEVNSDCVDSSRVEKPIIFGQNDKKKTVFRRLSSIFSKSKTSPKQSDTKARLSFADKVENNRNSFDKRVVIARSKSSDNGPILANNEFVTSQNFLVGNKEREKLYDSDDKRSSISSVLTAAADEDNIIETPSVTRKHNPSMYRNIDFNRSKLFNEVGKPRPQIAQPMYSQNRQQPVYKDPRSSLRKSNDYQFQPVKNVETLRPSSTPIKRNNIQPPTRVANGSATIDVRSAIDPFTFAKIHEIKRKTDRAFQNDTQPEKIQFNNSNFVRNSNLRSSDNFPATNVSRLENLHRTPNLPQPQPQRSQSVLDNMTCYQNSLYGEVTYRQPNGRNVNVMMRRPSTSTLDKKQIMDKIYEYYRKSVNNTPVSYQENSNIYQKSTHNPHNRSLNETPTYWQLRGSMERSGNRLTKPVEHSSQLPMRRQNISESDSEFPLESISSIDNLPRFSSTSYSTSRPTSKQSNDPSRIYDVVHQSPRDALYGYLNRQNVLSSPSPRTNSLRRGIPVATRPAPIIPQSPLLLSNEVDIIYNNKIYRPIATIQPNRLPQTNSPIQNRSENDKFRRTLLDKIRQDDYQNDKSSRNQQNEQAIDERIRRSSGRRDDREKDIRRHTLGNDMNQYMGHGGSLQRSMDLEMNQSQKSRKGIPIRAYTPQNQGPLFDDDPGIMSEVETASTGFRRGGKQRSSLPVVRTPSKTLERPLGLVFLQYRSETKRALLPNEITSIDTVRALFVRSFPRQLSMMYLEGPNVKIYIHDSSKDMFYELEDVRSHLREIRDRSVLRLFESNEVAAAPQILSGNPGIPQPLPQQGGHWDQDPSYFSEPEFDTEYQHQHVHKSKGATLPRGHIYNDRAKNSMNIPPKPIRSYGSRGSLGQFPYPADQLYSIPDGYMSSPERGTRAYEEPYYTQYGGSRGSSITPIIDEESNPALIEDQYSMYSVKVPNRNSRNPNQMYDTARPEDLHRIRVEHMERQLANLTGLVQKALVQNPQINPIDPVQNSNYRNANGALDDLYLREKAPKLGKSYKSVSFEKSVSFSDDIQGIPKSHSPQHMADTKPTKPAIKSSTLPRTSSQERDRLKPVPPLKQSNVVANHYRADLTLAPEAYNHLRSLQKKAKDLRNEVKTLRRLTQAQAVAVREDVKDTFMRIRATLMATSGNQWGQGDQEKTRISREEEIYKQEVIRLEKDLADLEGSVEVLRGEVINRRSRVNMAAVEDMALVLSRASKTVAELKMRFPGLQQNLRNILSNEMERVCREEAFLKDEPDRLEIALRRCKKLTGTLVTLKRLASVQEQRTTVEPTQAEEATRVANDFVNNSNKPTPPRSGSDNNATINLVPENALDALLDELQTFAKPSFESRPDESDDSSQTLQNTVTTKLSQSQLYPETPSTAHGLRRLASYPSGSDTDQDQISPPRPIGKPPVPERNSELLSRYGHKKLPPPPPPRSSSSRSPQSPTSPNLPPRGSDQQMQNSSKNNNAYSQNDQDSGSESTNSQENNSQRQMKLEMRHQELLKKQKQLQEQYQRLQQMSKNSIPLAPGENDENESHLSGSMKNLYSADHSDKVNDNVATSHPIITTNKVYETDIL